MRWVWSHGELNLEQGWFVHRDGRSLCLAPREIALLDYLLQRPFEDVDRDTLRVEVFGQHPATLSRAVDSTVARLRKKIEADPTRPEILLTIRSCGYRLVLQHADPPPSPSPATFGGPRPPTLVVQGVAIDMDRGLVTRGRSDPVSLSVQQRDLLSLLASRPGIPVPTDILCRRLGLGVGGRRALATAVYRLRCLLEIRPSRPEVILGRRGWGYWLAAPEDLEPRAPRTLASILDLARRTLGYQGSGLFVRRDHGWVELGAAGGGRRTVGRSPFLDEVVSARVPMRIVDTRRCPTADLIQGRGRSAIAAPVVPFDDLQAALAAFSPVPGALSEVDEGVLTSLAEVLAAAMVDCDPTHNTRRHAL